jgi:uncharacterized membrane protein YccC
MTPRGTTRTPGADPTRLPIGLDLRALSVVEGVRAGLAAALPVAASVWLNQPLFGLAALGALLTCICDPGGALRRRLPLLAGFVGVGALLIGGFGLLRGAGIAATLALALPVLFCTSFLRVWGAPAGAVGNLLGVLLILGTDAALAPLDALHVSVTFAAGGAWALLLTLAVWRLHPFGPARRAVADVWSSLAGMTRLLRVLLRENTPAGADWEGQARASRGAVRGAIERARTTLMDTMEARGPASASAAQNLMRLEAADQLFGALIALSDLLEEAGPTLREAADQMLRRLAPVLGAMADATEREHAERLPRFERAIAAMLKDAEACLPLRTVMVEIAERLRVATRLIDPAAYLPGSGSQGDAGISVWRRLCGPPAANWTWKSTTLRHAARVSLTTTAALAYTLFHHGPYTHWLTITLVLVMQPFFAATWQRTLERVAGTLLGGTVAAVLTTLMHTRLHLAGLLPVLGAFALAVRQVSYGVYIAIYTPVVILLVEQIHPVADQMSIALARASYTVAGGLLAVVANLVLWPSWQPAKVVEDLAGAISAHAAYARAVLLDAGDNAAPDRRRAGLASNNLEASLQLAMNEPARGQRDVLQAALAADATLRRIAGRLAALTVERGTERLPCATRQWVPDALDALACHAPPPPRPREPARSEALERLARQVELLRSTIRRVVTYKADAGHDAAADAEARAPQHQAGTT